MRKIVILAGCVVAVALGCSLDAEAEEWGVGGDAGRDAPAQEMISSTLDDVIDDSCTFEGVKLAGKVEIVENFGDFEVEVVDHFPDLKVQKVDNFADDCGEWEIVENFGDFKVEIVDNFGDFKIQYVDHFPGVP